MKHKCDVKVTLNCKNFQVERNFEAHIYEKISALCNKYGHKLIKAHTVFSKDSDGGYTSKVDVEGEYGSAVVLSGGSRSNNIFESFDVALKSVENQIRDHKEKNLRTNRHSGIAQKDERNLKQIDGLRTTDDDFMTLGDDEKDAEITPDSGLNTRDVLTKKDDSMQTESDFPEETIIITSSPKKQ